MFTHASQCVTKKKYSNVIHYCVQVVREKTNRNKIKKWCHDSWASIVIGQDNWLGQVPAVNQWWLLGQPTWPLRLRLANGEDGGVVAGIDLWSQQWLGFALWWRMVLAALLFFLGSSRWWLDFGILAVFLAVCLPISHFILKPRFFKILFLCIDFFFWQKYYFHS